MVLRDQQGRREYKVLKVHLAPKARRVLLDQQVLLDPRATWVRPVTPVLSVPLEQQALLARLARKVRKVTLDRLVRLALRDRRVR